MCNISTARYAIHDAVWYKDTVGRIEEVSKWHDGRIIYLIQLSTHRYFYAFEEDLQDYIG